MHQVRLLFIKERCYAEGKGNLMETVKIKCKSCNGTGLYSGMAEADGCAVVCYTCEGTGCDTLSYTPFTARTKKAGVKRVFAKTCGYGHAADDYTDKKTGKVTKFSEGGASYEEWLSGKKPKPVKELYCPYLWTSQGLQNKDKNDLYKTRCSKSTSMGSSCSHYADKATCWGIFEGKAKK